MKPKMDRREFLKTSLTTSLTAGLTLLPQKTLAMASRKKAKQPNILWIMLDDGRADALGCYGRTWAKTPHLDAIAQQGVRFENAIVQSPVCIPSRASMKTGYYPHKTGIIAMGKPAKIPSSYLKNATPRYNLLNSFTQAGIKPINIGKAHYFRNDWYQRSDPKQNFDVFGRPVTDLAKKRMAESNSRYPDVVTNTHRWAIGGTIPLKPEETSTWKTGDLALETLKALTLTDKPFFLRVSFHAPHVPVRVPKEFLIDPDKITLPLPTDEELNSKPPFEKNNLRTYAGSLDLTKQQIGIARGTYYGMLSLVDVQVGRIVEFLKKQGIINNTIIAVNSDQGFLLGEHGIWKKRCFYDANVRIPFILSCPDRLPAAKIIDEPVEMTDFLPTLMQLSNLDVPQDIEGKSLLPLINGKVEKWRHACFCEHDYSQDMYDELRQGSGRCIMVRTKDFKLIKFMDERATADNSSLYNLKSDPDETQNLYNNTQYSQTITHLEDLAQKWVL